MSEPVTLVRRLGLAGATALVVSNMIGTGIFTTTGFLAADLGSAFVVLLCWIVGGASALLGAICYSELALNFSSSGGEYLYLSRAYGPTWGFVTGWVSFFAGFSAPIAAAALAFASYVAFFFPSWQPRETGNSSMLRLGPQQLISCGLVVSLSMWNCLGIKRSALLQNSLTALKIAMLVTFVVAGLLVGHGDWSNLSQKTMRAVETPLWEQFAVSLFWIYVSYSGWNAATYVAEEIESPQRNLPRALAIGTGLVTVVYLALNVTFLYAAPLESMKGIIAIGALAASRLFGPQAAGAFNALMAFALLSTVNAMIIAGPRVYYAVARDGQFFSPAALVHPRWRTPVNSILAQAICAMLLALTPFPQLMLYIGFTLNVFAVMSVSSLFFFRRRPGWRTLRIIDLSYPLLPLLFAVIGIWMITEGVLKKPLISGITVLTLLTGALVYRTTFGHLRSSVDSAIPDGPSLRAQSDEEGRYDGHVN
ncbi:MAG: amino acid permease [Bryobacteraceae bacterium]